MAKAASDSHEEHRNNTQFLRPTQPRPIHQQSQASRFIHAERLNKLSVDESFEMIDGLRIQKGGK